MQDKLYFIVPILTIWYLFGVIGGVLIYGRHKTLSIGDYIFMFTIGGLLGVLNVSYWYTMEKWMHGDTHPKQKKVAIPPKIPDKVPVIVQEEIVNESKTEDIQQINQQSIQNQHIDMDIALITLSGSKNKYSTLWKLKKGYRYH